VTVTTQTLTDDHAETPPGGTRPQSADPAGTSVAVAAPGASAAAPADDQRARVRREMGLVAGLCAVGGGLALFGAGQTWLRVVAERRPPLPDVTLDLSGRDLEPLVAGLGIVGLAGVVGLLATRRRGRLAVAAVIALSGLLVLASALRRLGVPDTDALRELVLDSGRAAGVGPQAAITATASPGWALVAAAGGLLLAVGGGLALLRSRHWPAMSARYEAPQARAAGRPTTTAGVWDSLDRGDDPTR